MVAIEPYVKEEAANAWRLWKAGMVREGYARADVPGVVIVFDCRGADEARRYLADLPLSKAGLLEWEHIPLDAPLPLEFVLDSQVEVGPRSIGPAVGRSDASLITDVISGRLWMARGLNLGDRGGWKSRP